MKTQILFALAVFTASTLAQAHGSVGADCHGGNRCRTEEVSRTVSGPANYHATYAAIQNTNLTIQNFTLRGEDGSTISISTSPTAIDLQALGGPGQGIALNTIGVTIPAGFQLAEITTQVVKSAGATLVSSSAPNCDLETPSVLHFYTSAPFALANDSYLVKVAFSPLDAIELNVITKNEKTTCCPSNHWWDKDDGGSCTVTPSSSTTNQCKLVNRRFAISSILGG